MARRGTVKLTGPAGVATFEWQAQKGGGFEVYRIDGGSGKIEGTVLTAETFIGLKAKLGELLWVSLNDVI